MHGKISRSDGLAGFMQKFHFQAEHSLWLGVERECFLLDTDGTHVAKAAEALSHIHEKRWRGTIGGVTHYVSPRKCVGYELSAAQLETRTPIHRQHETDRYLRLIDTNLRKNLREIGLQARYSEVAPVTIPLDVYPDPSGRYKEIAASMPRDTLLAACRIAGTHVHIGMPDRHTALRVYNSLVEHCDTLMSLGDDSGGERLKIYGVVKSDYMPKTYRHWDDFYDDALQNGFAIDPRNNWRLIRITKLGTIEFRMFGSSEKIDQISLMARLCYLLCKKAMN